MTSSIVLTPSAARDRLTEGMYMPRNVDDPIGRLEDALPKVIAAERLEGRLYRALDSKALVTRDYDALVQEALQRGALNESEAVKLRAALEARAQVIQVDDFPAQEPGYRAIGKIPDHAVERLLHAVEHVLTDPFY